MHAESISVATLLAWGLNLAAPDIPRLVVPAGTTCAISGERLLYGYRVQDIVTNATAEFIDTYRGDVHGFVSEDVARCIRSSNPRAGNPCARSHLAFEDGTYYGPLISRESAATLGRPCWRDLVREVWPARQGQRCLILFTTDTKKRLWPKARVTQLGAHTTVFLHDGASQASGPRTFAWPDLLHCLTDVETVYAEGIGKPHIGTSLYKARKVLDRLGYPAMRRYEQLIAPWRTHPAFTIALLIAQRQGEAL